MQLTEMDFDWIITDYGYHCTDKALSLVNELNTILDIEGIESMFDHFDSISDSLDSNDTCFIELAIGY